MVSWVEIFAAIIVAAILFPIVQPRAPAQPIKQYVNYIDDPVVQAKLEAIEAQGPYRDYSNITVDPDTGRVLGGL